MDIATICNEANSPAAPRLTEQATHAELVRWLVWCDPNGDWAGSDIEWSADPVAESWELVAMLCGLV